MGERVNRSHGLYRPARGEVLPVPLCAVRRASRGTVTPCGLPTMLPHTAHSRLETLVKLRLHGE